MAKSFLRSGSLDGILALGEDGLPVYALALQLRETLRLRGQQRLLDCLAIPQPNEAGDRLDWYAPIEGKVTSWSAASEIQRASALSQLEQCQSAVVDISRRAQRAEKSAQKLFGMLLAKAIQFPDQNHVYLVGDKPVLTFWGFVKLDQKSRSDPLDCLRPPPPEPDPVIIPARHEPMENPAVALEATPLLIAELNPPDPIELPQLETIPPVRRLRRRVWWVPPALALLAVLVFQVHSTLSKNQVWPPVPAPVAGPQVLTPPPAIATPQPANEQTNTATPPALPGKSRPTTIINPAPAADGSGAATAAANTGALSGIQNTASNDNSAEGKDNVSSAEDKSVAAAGNATSTLTADNGTNGRTNADSVTVSQNSIPLTSLQAKNALRLPAEAVREGSTTFLDGHWRVSVAGKYSIPGKAPSIDYLIKNGNGVAKIRYDGISCRADVHAGLMKSGNLLFRSQAKARCSDGSTYPMPQIVCKQSVTGIADCQSRYDSDQVFPTTIERENKK